MTEDEAKTKWCPFARISDGEPPTSVNRPEPYGDVPHCLGSGCMAWRWEVPDPATYKSAPGFCGLAGKP